MYLDSCQMKLMISFYTKNVNYYDSFEHVIICKHIKLNIKKSNNENRSCFDSYSNFDQSHKLRLLRKTCGL